MSLRLTPPLRADIAAARRPLAGIWVCSGSPLVAEICAGAGMDWLLIDMEHCPNGLEGTLAQLQAVAAYVTTPVVRVPTNDTVVIKQVLDLGAQNILVPMVSSADEAVAAVEAVRYPPRGRRGVGSALARSARWNRVDDYLRRADEHVSLFVQIETPAGVAAASAIAAVDGVDGVFVGPSDLAAAIGRIGEPAHPEVQALVRRAHELCAASNVACGSIAGSADGVRQLREYGANFLALGTDMMLLQNALQARLDEVRI